ncbi:uncharacterized protein LOC109542704 isoform X2 [Dendroctonus ponderosae]|uniref:MICOS complex subunit MIC13 n=1 Tax=Dendroctonus ponderosae TaxID=77166 RepID=A0AAR5Q2Z9_DENPD|nr:uncharacterized protein LOC109542704 isoform X2 [Dendroctonus ponderosae]
MSDCGKPEEKCLKKSNILVYQQPSGQRTERKRDDCKGRVKIPLCKPQPKPIRVCTGADLRKMCSPKVCPCEPSKKKPFGILRVLGFGFKSALAAAAVYITYDMGIWGSTEETQNLYGNACTLFGQPQPKKNSKWDPPSCEAESGFFSKPNYKPYDYCQDPPIRAEESFLKFKHMWNRSVSYIFHGIANFPGNLTGKDSKLKPDEEATKPKECISYKQLSDAELEKIKSIYK